MLNQLNHWIYLTSTAADALLLGRILQLRLHRTYLFITLAALLSVIFDVVSLWFGMESRETVRILIYSRFLYAFVYPAAVYDVWEELKPQIARIRRFATIRLVMSLTMATLIGFLITAVGSGDEAESEAVLDTFAIILWAAVSTASFAFLWATHRTARAQKIVIPNNTAVWLLYFQLLLAADALNCFFLIVGQQFSSFVINSVDLSLNIFSILITLWCTWKLRALASGVPSTPENASL